MYYIHPHHKPTDMLAQYKFVLCLVQNLHQSTIYVTISHINPNTWDKLILCSHNLASCRRLGREVGRLES